MVFTELIRRELRRGGEVYASLPDLFQAFDRMSHVKTARALRGLGVEGALFEAVMRTMLGRKLVAAEAARRVATLGVRQGRGRCGGCGRRGGGAEPAAAVGGGMKA